MPMVPTSRVGLVFSDQPASSANRTPSVTVAMHWYAVGGASGALAMTPSVHVLAAPGQKRLSSAFGEQTCRGEMALFETGSILAIWGSGCGYQLDEPICELFIHVLL